MSKQDMLKDYVEVNVRIERFYEKYPEGSIQTEITHLDNEKVIVKAYTYRDREDTRPATGHAMEREGSSFINKTSHIENCETSAVGRALALFGFEVKKSVASKEEVENAKLNQGESKLITLTQKNSIKAKVTTLHKLKNVKESEIYTELGVSVLDTLTEQQAKVIEKRITKWVSQADEPVK